MKCKNKLDKHFNITNVEQEFNYLRGEVDEAYDAWKNQKDDFGLELADVAIYLMGLAQMNGLNLGEQIEKKIAINKKRVYVMENGKLVKKNNGVINTPFFYLCSGSAVFSCGSLFSSST